MEKTTKRFFVDDDDAQRDAGRDSPSASQQGLLSLAEIGAGDVLHRQEEALGVLERANQVDEEQVAQKKSRTDELYDVPEHLQVPRCSIPHA